ncbi:MAG: MarR family transcriptional regulator [Actinomycetaceae bacterium]|nr:MarR family transcriptional regulator [Actinomycetaceae bacterium]
MSRVSQAEPEHGAGARLGYSIKRVEQRLMAAKAKALREFGLTVPQYVALMALREIPDQSAAQLARVALVSPQTVATIVGNLEAKGLISRRGSPQHARVVVCSLTPAGQELVARADAVVGVIEDDVSGIFTPDELAHFHEYLTRVEEHLRRV